ncbi:MAG: sugar phosphate nucleotidyltransferase [Thermoplasmata archaeon]
MKVVILAGGRGTRMSEVTSVIPKPMVEVAGKPLLWYIMNIYSSYGFNEFILAVGYKKEKIEEYFADSKNNKLNWKVSIVDVNINRNTGTGGAIREVADYIDGDEFMMTYGDGVADINLDALLKFHRGHGRLATITAVKMPRFGIVTVENDGRVSAFQEKNLEHSPLINGGFMVLSKKVIDYIDGPETAFETTPMEKLCRDGELYAYVHKGFWKAVDSLRDKMDLEAVLTDKDNKVKLWKT